MKESRVKESRKKASLPPSGGEGGREREREGEGEGGRERERFYNCSLYSIEKADLPVGGQPD